jgi:hypothetical protein
MVFRFLVVRGFCQCWAPQRLVQAGSTAMIAIPVRSAIEVRRARSFPVGMPEMICRKRRRRPCFSRVFSPRSAVTSFDIGLTAGRILDALSRRGTA